MQKKYVYLCGGINKLSDAECKDWRQVAKDTLNPESFEVLDPMRRDYRGFEGDCVDLIFDGDMEDIVRSKILLVRAERPSWGTAMEIVYARFLGKTIVIYGAGERPSPWLIKHADYILDTLEHAIQLINHKFSK
ncbi:MAG: hypothetical protein ACYSUV_00455 [Planctomycetota bacterium]|jgi:hypothetical protein